MDEIEQGSAEWFALRCGKVTASRVADVVARTKSGPAASRANYLAQLVAERLTGNVGESYSNATMQWGTDQEPEARTAYEFLRNAAVEQVGFVGHPTIVMSGASPDGLVGADGLVEIKCPNTATHIETLLGHSIPGKYETQMLWQMACTGRTWCDFVSYDPRLPESMQIFVRRLDRNDARIAELEAEVVAFLTELDATVAALTARYGERAWPELVSHGNQALRYELGIDADPDFDPAAAFPPHRSLPDAIVTAHILRKQLALRPLERLIEISSEPGFLYWCPGQKHKGKTYKEVASLDLSYLGWIADKSDMGEAEKFTAKHWLAKVAA